MFVYFYSKCLQNLHTLTPKKKIEIASKQLSNCYSRSITPPPPPPSLYAPVRFWTDPPPLYLHTYFMADPISQKKENHLYSPTAAVNLNWRWYFGKISVNTCKNIIFNFTHSMYKFWMQGNIEIIKSTEWTYTIIVKKLSIEKNCKIFYF